MSTFREVAFLRIRGSLTRNVVTGLCQVCYVPLAAVLTWRGTRDDILTEASASEQSSTPMLLGQSRPRKFSGRARALNEPDDANVC